MVDEPDNLTLKLLRDMRQDIADLRSAVEKDIADVRATVERVDTRLQHVEKQIDDLHKVVTYSLGQSTETQFRQSQQESKLNDMFEQLAKFLANKEPV